MRRIVLFHCCFFLFSVTVFARVGVVQSKDGKVLEGHIRLSSNGVTVINATLGSSVTIAPDNLSDLYFDPRLESKADLLSQRSRSHDPDREPWQAEDIGSVKSAGSVDVASDLFRVRSVGTNIAGHSDAFHFVYRPCGGNCEIVARVVNVQPHARSKAGIMIRESLSADSANVFFGLAGREGGTFQHRDGTGEDTLMESMPEVFVPYWLRLKRSGEAFTASVSRNGTRWVRCRSISLPMTENVWIGLAAAAGQEQIAGIATMDNIRQDVVVPHTTFIPQLHLQSGSVVVGPILTSDSGSFSINSFPFSVPASTVSHVLFRWLPFRYTTQIATGTPGLLLTSGQFVEGSFNRLDQDRITLSSVLFGLKSFDAQTDVVALVFRRPFAETPLRNVIVLVNGTTLCVTNSRFENNEIFFNEESLGPCKVGMPELLWLRGGDYRR